MEEVILRQGQIEDCKIINEFMNRYIEETEYLLKDEKKGLWNTEVWLNEHESYFPVIVAELNGEVVGYATVSEFRSISGYRNTGEVSIYVKQNSLNKGVGQLLMNKLIKESKIREYHCLVSVITSSNENSIAFHKRNGFEVKGVLNEIGYKNGKYVDVVFMTRILEV